MHHGRETNTSGISPHLGGMKTIVMVRGTHPTCCGNPTRYRMNWRLAWQPAELILALDKPTSPVGCIYAPWSGNQHLWHFTPPRRHENHRYDAWNTPLLHNKQAIPTTKNTKVASPLEAIRWFFFVGFVLFVVH